MDDELIGSSADEQPTETDKQPAAADEPQIPTEQPADPPRAAVVGTSDDDSPDVGPDAVEPQLTPPAGGGWPGRSQGPPPDWVEKVQRGAPELLSDGPPVRSAPLPGPTVPHGLPPRDSEPIASPDPSHSSRSSAESAPLVEWGAAQQEHAGRSMAPFIDVAVENETAPPQHAVIEPPSASSSSERASSALGAPEISGGPRDSIVQNATGSTREQDVGGSPTRAVPVAGWSGEQAIGEPADSIHWVERQSVGLGRRIESAWVPPVANVRPVASAPPSATLPPSAAPGAEAEFEPRRGPMDAMPAATIERQPWPPRGDGEPLTAGDGGAAFRELPFVGVVDIRPTAHAEATAPTAEGLTRRATPVRDAGRLTPLATGHPASPWPSLPEPRDDDVVIEMASALRSRDHWTRLMREQESA